MAGVTGVSETVASVRPVSSPVQPSEELPADPGWEPLKQYLIERTGLAYYLDKDADLARRVHRRLAERGCPDCSSYLRLLRNGGGVQEMEAVIAEIMIGETYFFRHREHFDALRDIVLPDLAARSGPRRQLRIWCAGCADGAEPYSLAILLRREMGHALPAGWEIPILGTDINRRFLASAAEGVFQTWSLRATPESVKQACFARHDNQWILAPEYRAGVSFLCHNLAEDAFPPHGSAGAFELIICRNVMIYFAPELMQRVVGAFHDCLAPGGWLLVGPSEPNMTHFASFRTVNAPGVTLYQRERSPAPALPAAQVYEAWHPAPPPAEESASEALPLLQEGGQQPDSLNPVRHFHIALALEEAGDLREAEHAFRRAIYLDRRWAAPHYHLGVLLDGQGDRPRAERCYANALEALAAQPDDSLVPGDGEITVAELRSLVRLRAPEKNKT
jgi:chemotaxis protein methyltransferase CheR